MKKEKEEGNVKCISLCVLDNVLQVARMPEFKLPSANHARVAQSLHVWERSEREHVTQSLFILHKSFDACE